MATKNAILKGLVEGQIVELLIKTNVENVLMEDGSTTLAAKLAEMVTEIGKKANSTDVTAEIKAAIDELIGGATGTWDTLKEIETHFTEHASEYTALVQTVAGKASQADLDALEEVVAGKVDKVDGKGLSTNDYTTAEKEKLAGIASGAQVNVLEGVKVNGQDVTIDENKKANITVPTGAMANKDIVSETDLAEELKAKVNAAAEGNHSHANKALLDTYTQTEANLADAVAKKHEHTNKDVLDGISAAKVAAWDRAEQNAKDYADGLDEAMDGRVKPLESDNTTNKADIAQLKTDVQTLQGASHTHANKDLLDSYDQTNANIKDAVEKKHAHANATVLDGITAGDVENWNGKSTMYIQETQPANLKAGDLWVQIV